MLDFYFSEVSPVHGLPFLDCICFASASFAHKCTFAHLRASACLSLHPICEVLQGVRDGKYNVFCFPWLALMTKIGLTYWVPFKFIEVTACKLLSHSRGPKHKIMGASQGNMLLLEDTADPFHWRFPDETPRPAHRHWIWPWILHRRA